MWPQNNILKLSKNMKVLLGEEKFAGKFADLLLEIGNSYWPLFDEMITIPENMCTVVTTVQDLISQMYSDIAHMQAYLMVV